MGYRFKMERRRQGTDRKGAMPRKSLESSDGKLAVILNVPTVVFLFFIMVFPIGYSLIVSFYDLNYKRPGNRPFVGLMNYIDLLSDIDFLETLGRTGIFVFFSVGSVLILGILIAYLLSQEFRGRMVLRTLILIPWAIPPVVNGIMWKYILDSSYGVLNGILYKMGFIESYIPFMATDISAFAWVVFADMWKNLPFGILLLLASMQTIPNELYESARVDGASNMRQFFTIMLPMISAGILVVLIFQTMVSLRVFDLIYVMTSGGPGDSTTVIGWKLYEESFKFLKFGRGSAIGYIITLITFVLASLYYRLFRRRD